MTPRTLTVGVVLVTIAGLVGYDVFAFVRAGTDATISSVVWEAASSPPLTFVAGFLCGHLFWNSSSGRAPSGS